jgi:hypothetical protein
MYVAMSFLMDPMGGLGTDTGGKVATLEVMTRDGLSFNPDIGYWASATEPDASHHGLWYTAEVGDKYVNVTTLPMIEMAAPLYRLGGYRAALLLPMLGAIAAAFASRTLAERCGGDETQGWVAFWVVGLCSPITIYALDLWEHTIGVALVAWGVIALLRARDQRSALAAGLLAGAAFGGAYSMRTEALVYGVVAVGVICGGLALRRRVSAAAITAVAAAAGVVLAALANLALEQALLGESFRAGRASATAGGGGQDLALRLKEAIITGAGLLPSLEPADMALGVALAVALVVAARFSADPAHRRVAFVAGAIAIALYLVRIGEGAGFVPGLMATAPFAAVALAFAPANRDARQVMIVAMGAPVLVWSFQYTGGAVPQWGGRYLLPSCLLLVALGIVAGFRMPRQAFTGFVAASIVLTGFGLIWMSERTHEVGRAAREVAAFPEPAVVSSENFFLRELGAEYQGDRTRWLSARNPEDAIAAVGILGAEGVDEFAYLTRSTGAAEVIDGYGPVDERTYHWLDVPWRVITYRRLE